MIKLSITIVSYNTKNMTLACLESVYQQQNDGKFFEVIVVDNASRDDSAEAISKNFPQVTLIESKENLGFAKANNLAAEQAKGEYLLLLNPDTVVLNHAIDKLLSFAESFAAEHIWGGRTLSGDGTLDKASCWGKPTPWSLFCYSSGLLSLFRNSSLFNPEAYGDWQRDTVREVDIVSGCFLLIKKTLWDSLGGFDPKFFMYGEEADLCLRAKKLGVQPIICPDATIIHYGGASETVRADKTVRLFKAKIELAKRHWKPAWFPFGILMYKWAALSRWMIFLLLSLINKKHSDTAGCWRGIWQRRGEWEIGYP